MDKEAYNALLLNKLQDILSFIKIIIVILEIQYVGYTNQRFLKC